MDGEEPGAEILVFISGSREVDGGQYSVFVKGGLEMSNTEQRARDGAISVEFANRACVRSIR